MMADACGITGSAASSGGTMAIWNAARPLQIGQLVAGMGFEPWSPERHIRVGEHADVGLVELRVELRGEVPGEQQRIERNAKQRQGRGNASMLTLNSPHHGDDVSGLAAAAQVPPRHRCFGNGRKCHPGRAPDWH